MSLDPWQAHDAALIETASHFPPIDDWEQIRRNVTPAVWARILGDLSPITRRRIDAQVNPGGSPDKADATLAKVIPFRRRR